tara:strand:- start:6857 stop:7720 length:864 start_codon:yes stop_codon:yes gene_type:complete
MSVVYWTGAVDGSFSTVGNWTATPAEGDIAVINTGSATIAGGDFTAFCDWSSIIIGPGFTGSIGSSSSRVHAPTNNLQVTTQADVYFKIEASAVNSTVQRIMLNEWGSVVDIDDNRTATTREIFISRSNKGAGTATIDCSAAANALLAVSDMSSETINITGSFANLRMDSGTVKGGDVTTQAIVSGGEWHCGDATDLRLFAGAVYPGATEPSTITSAHIYGGELSLEKAIGYAVTLPNGTTGFLNLYHHGVADLQTDGVRPPVALASRGSGLFYVSSGTSLTAGVVQ